MKQAYQNFNFNNSTLLLITQADNIIREYMRAGFVLTLRQLYYQFVARGLLENTQRNYKKLGTVVNNGRLAGALDWDGIEDRTRNIIENPHWDSPANIVASCAAQFRIDLWEDQPQRVEVWIEKEALAGVIERPCRELDVPYFSCRGYVSQSEQRKAGQRAMFNLANYGQRTTILHLGDHDPSGIDMTRDNDQRLDMFSEYQAAVDVRRIALNMDQIEELNPPPNPAKLSDSRASDYVARFGYHSWELDALEPRYIDKLIRQEIIRLMDEDLMREAVARQQAGRDRLHDVAAELSEESF